MKNDIKPHRKNSPAIPAGLFFDYARRNRGDAYERYVKTFDAWQHLVVMLYGVMERFDSMREIVKVLEMEARKLAHLDPHNAKLGIIVKLNAVRHGILLGGAMLWQRYAVWGRWKFVPVTFSRA